jgi:hypothetical protein
MGVGAVLSAAAPASAAACCPTIGMLVPQIFCVWQLPHCQIDSQPSQRFWVHQGVASIVSGAVVVYKRESGGGCFRG